MRNQFYLGTMKSLDRYNDNFRRKVAILAAEVTDVKFVAEVAKVSVGSVYRWMKAYDLFRQYAKKKHDMEEYPQVCFVKASRYPTDFRRQVVQYAQKEGTLKAAKLYGVSRGSVDNWIKAFQNNHAYLNRDI